MAQEFVVIREVVPVKAKLHEALIECDSCTKIVPITMLCLYCGAPILYREPQED
jgi:hypothetical protein